MSAPRYAIYYTPPPDSPLDRFGSGVLGYDCFEAREVLRQPIEGINPAIMALLAVEPRRYGFHATLKAPFRLRDASEADLSAAVTSFATAQRAVELGPLELSAMGSFLVLRPSQQVADLQALAAACVEKFDRFRAPMSDGERARRLSGSLTPRQVALMERWGYPYVFEEFRFHMTLAGPVPQEQREMVTRSLARAFEPLAGDHVEIGAISLDASG